MKKGALKGERLAIKNRRWPAKIAIYFLIIMFAFSSLLQAQSKKYQVVVPKANLHLDPDEKSPVVVAVPAGEILSQASAVKFRHNWIFVYYTSPEKGRTLAGYVQQQTLRKLFPEVNAMLISSGEKDFKPKDLDLNQKYTFPVYWGMSRSKLIQIEGKPLAENSSEETEVYQYRREIMNKQCLVEYIFWRDELVSARYYLLDGYTDYNYYISDFLKIKNYLESKFGQPVNDRVVWLDATYQNKNEYWGKALGAGQLEFRCSWLVKDTEVDITLTGSNNQVAFVAECVGEKYKNFFSH